MPAARLPDDGKHETAFRTKLEIVLSLLEQAQAAGVWTPPDLLIANELLVEQGDC